MDYNTNIIEVSGKNLATFFQNIITNDINLLNNKKSIYTALLTPQGKFLYDFIILKIKEKLLIEINKNYTEDLILELKKYDLRKNLVFNNKSSFKSYVFLLKNLDAFKQMELSKFVKSSKEECIIFRDPRKENYLIRVLTTNKNEEYFDKNFSKLNINEIEKERIKLCIPSSELDMEKNKSFILNYGFENINAICFKKGCYIGQENTARMKYRGNIKYGLKTLKLISGSFPPLNSQIAVNGKKAGTIKSRRESFSLALLRSDLIYQNDKVVSFDENFKAVIF